MSHSVFINLDETFDLTDIRKSMGKYAIREDNVGDEGETTITRKLNSDKVLNDLRRVVAIIECTPEIYLIKECSAISQGYTITYLTTRQAEEKLKYVKIYMNYYPNRTEHKDLSAWDFINNECNRIYFMYSKTRFFSKDPNTFNYFHGYDYQFVENVDLDLINPWLDHVKDIIADNNEEVFEYIIKWFSYIIQNPNGKTEIALIIKGLEGTGKNTFFTDILCRLMDKYANYNITDMNMVVGNFNSSIENKKLIILNEAKNADNLKYIDSDSLKSIITDKIGNINEKFKPARMFHNVLNLIIVSNNDTPVKLNKNDRRFMATFTSSKRKGDYGYFNELIKVFEQPNFYENLLTYFMNYNIKDFNPRIIPITEAKQDLIENSKSAVEHTIETYINEFRQGIESVLAYGFYANICKDYGFKQGNINTFGSQLKQYCNKTRHTKPPRKYIYTLREELKDKYKVEDNIENDEDYNCP